MRPYCRHPGFRLTATFVATSLITTPVLPNLALAQPAPPNVVTPAEAPDPPARVGRLARLSGAVSFHTQADTSWATAASNYPVAAGTSLWTEPGASADIEVAGSRIGLSGASEFTIGTLDQTGMQATLSQGEIAVRQRGLGSNETWSVQTPRGLATFYGPGQFGIAAGTTESPTVVTVLEGAAQLSGPGIEQRIEAGQQAMVTGTDAFQTNVALAQPGPFLAAALQSQRPPPQRAAAPPPAVQAMPGGDELASYGSWEPAPDYGEVWYPPVSSGWVPYRDGHWAYVAPWGWTWIDDNPWGFAPSHYGRWVEIGGRWGWTPGMAMSAERYPVYAPALVAFIGLGAGVGLGAALAAGSIGWIPLGPREPYRPWYRSSDRYLRDVNMHHVNNVTMINRNVTVNTYVNRHAATMVPASAMSQSRSIRGMAQPVSAQTLGTTRPVFGQQPVRPSAVTAGVTPGLARQMNLAPVAGVPLRPSAPGPAVHPQAAAGGGGGFRPPLHNPNALPAVLTPGSPGLAQPRHQLPPLPAPGARPGPVGSGGPPGGFAPRGPGPSTVTPALVPPSGRTGPVGSGGQPGGGFAPRGTSSSTAAPALAPPNGRPGPGIGQGFPQVQHPAQGFQPSPGGPAPQHQAPQFQPPQQGGQRFTPPTAPHAPNPPAAPSMPQVHAPSTPVAPQFHAPPPQQFRQPPPAAPAYHPPAPAPQFHPAPAATQPHAAPAAPQSHPAPPPQPASQPQHHDKRPGER